MLRVHRVRAQIATGDTDVNAAKSRSMSAEHALGDADRLTEATHLREISASQWKSGVAAWLGWLFDGLEMHLYTLVATPLVVQLLSVASAADPAVKEKSAFIQAAFLVGWALGGAFFGRLGDVLGRSRSLVLTILTYAGFTGLSYFAQTWEQCPIRRQPE